jgi:hypothetical protein
MESVATLTAEHGTSIPAILLKTFAIYQPLLTANRESILSTPHTTHPYGSHPRQKLDVYLPSSSSLNGSDTPILIFLYGGGLIHGDKISPQFPLVYHNLGSFFAQRGITTVIPDYRRVNSQFGGEDAVYPSGAEDLSLTINWVVENLVTKNKGKQRDLVIMGNSAGGLHLGTWLLEPQFLEQRIGLIQAKEGSRLKGVIELAVPFSFSNAPSDLGSIISNYYGSPEKAARNSPHGHLIAYRSSKISREEAGVPKVLVLLGEHEPEEEIAGPTKRFVEEWKGGWWEGLEFRELKGHNHISPPWALMAGEKKGEEWAEGVVSWIKE